MTTFQMIIVGLGVLLGGSTFWPQMEDKGLLPKPSPKDKDKEVEDTLEVETCSTDSLCTVVSCWEELRNQLVDRGLTEAISELDKIFPLFVITDEPVKSAEFGDPSLKDVQGNVEL